MPPTQSTQYTSTQNLYREIFGALPSRDLDQSDIPDLMSFFEQHLTPQEVFVITKWFGIMTEKKTLEKIAAELSNSVSTSRTTQIKNKALRKLRHPLRSAKFKQLFASLSELYARISELEDLVNNLLLQNAKFSHRIAILSILEDRLLDASRQAEPSDPSLSLPIDRLDFSVRTYNVLKRANVETVADLIGHTGSELRRIRNLGPNILEEIIEKLASHGLSLAPEDK